MRYGCGREARLRRQGREIAALTISTLERKEKWVQINITFEKKGMFFSGLADVDVLGRKQRENWFAGEDITPIEGAAASSFVQENIS